MNGFFTAKITKISRKIYKTIKTSFIKSSAVILPIFYGILEKTKIGIFLNQKHIGWASNVLADCYEKNIRIWFLSATAAGALIVGITILAEGVDFLLDLINISPEISEWIKEHFLPAFLFFLNCFSWYFISTAAGRVMREEWLAWLGNFLVLSEAKAVTWFMPALSSVYFTLFIILFWQGIQYYYAVEVGVPMIEASDVFDKILLPDLDEPTPHFENPQETVDDSKSDIANSKKDKDGGLLKIFFITGCIAALAWTLQG